MAGRWLGLLALIISLEGCQLGAVSPSPVGQLAFRWAPPSASFKLVAIPEQTRFFRISIRGAGLSQPLETEINALLPSAHSYRLSLPVGPKEVTVVAYDEHKALSRARVSVEIRPALLTQAEMELVGILNPLQLDFQAAWPLPLELELELSGKALRDAQPWRYTLLLPVDQGGLNLPDIPAEEGLLRLRARPQGQTQWGEWLEQKLTGSLPLKAPFFAETLLESWQAFIPEWLSGQPEGMQVRILALMGNPQLTRLLGSAQLNSVLRARIQAELDRKRSAGNASGLPSPVVGPPVAASGSPAPQISASPQVTLSPSPEVSGSPATAPASPLAFYLAEAGDSYLRLTWDPVRGAAAYSLSLDGQLLSDSLNYTSYSLNGLSPQTSYHFLLRARNQAGESGAVTLVAQTLATGARTTGGGADPVPTATPLPAPVLESVSPLQAQIGSRLILRGQHFYPPLQVIFDGAYAAPVVSLTEHEIQVEIPALARQGQIQVQTASGSFATAIVIQTGAVQLEGGYH
ncbi:MAG: IPT/TIG domain-containing protein [Candidatus Sericytochromatia bacterium]|nr:IPT/TIG domain-containing protein [Candidatus Sericytochromatia bacterium]